ncbi:DUF6075 family protein [Desemzia sp. FAM 23988]|uniref:DUF6075 family protein n=1 Tax=unclassified Desemzia TaxID=2685243 RepID=UPI003885820A
MEMEYKNIHQLICSSCGSRAFTSSYGSNMEQNNISITCNSCRASTEVGRVDIKQDSNTMLVDTPTLQKSEIQLGLNKEHTDRLFKLIAKDNTRATDKERIALFFIISGNSDLYNKVNSLYDFDEHWIKPNYFENVDFSSGDRKMVDLAFNLYNNSSALAPLELFSTLDNDNYRLAMKAINIRFNK